MLATIHDVAWRQRLERQEDQTLLRLHTQAPNEYN